MKRKFLPFLLVMMFLATGTFAQRQVSTIERNSTKVEVQKKDKSSNSYTKVKAPPYTPSNAKGIILDEGFETWPLTGWTFYELGDPAGWVETSAEAHTGTTSAYHNDDNVASACQDWMVTPALVIDADNYNFSFWEYENYGTYADAHRVVILDGADPTTATELEELYTDIGTEDTWVEKTFSLAAYNGQTIYIGFYYEGDYADEWYLDDVKVSSPSALDASITGISTPIDGFITTTTDITANLLNVGTTDMTSCSINYNVYDVTNSTNVTSGTYAWTGTLAQGESEDVVVGNFTSALNTTYTITVTADLTSDEEPSNDEFSKEVSSGTILSVPYTQDFENAGAMPNYWANNTANDGNWEMTQAIGHGASADHTTGTGYYAGLDDSEGTLTDGDVAILETPWFNTTTMTAPLMKFYFQNIDDGASGVDQVTPLHVDVWNGTAWVEDILVITEEVNQWTEYSVLLSTYSSASLKIRFRGVGIGTDWMSDLSVDDFSITEAPANDLAVTGISPSWVYANESFTPEVTIMNFGAADQATYSVTVFSAPATYSETITVSSTIASGATFVVTTLPSWDNVPAGTYTLTAIVTLAGEEMPDNNTMSIDFQALDFGSYTEGTIYAFDAADWTSSGLQNHIVNVNTSDATISDVGASGVASVYCGDFIDGLLVGISDTTAYAFASNGVAVELAAITGLDAGASGLTWDADGGEIYVSTTASLYTIDTETDVATLVGTYSPTTTTLMLGIASDLDGNLYGVGINDTLYSIDKTTGVPTIIGPLGIDISYAQDIGYDRTNGILYGTLYLGGGTGGLYTIDVATGTATQISSDFEDELTMCAVFYELPPTYTVTFTVDDGTDPIEGASIAIDGETLTTDASGVATIELENGTYEAITSATGYVNDTTSVTIDDANMDVAIHLDIVESIDDINANVSITPNPTSGIITITADQNFSVEVIDIAGRLISSTEMMSNSVTIDISSENAGMYIVRLSNENGTSTYKVIKK